MLFQVLFLVIFVTSPAFSRYSFGLDPSCPEEGFDAFKCGSKCLSAEQICNGVRDCDDGSDEIYCDIPSGGSALSIEDPVIHRIKRQSTCRKNQWQCRDGTCISFDGKCDGAVDCPDRSDETHALCRKMPCQSNWFRCTYGACVDGTAPCNGAQDCADNSDELLPRCRNETMEVKGKFKCKDGTWIPASDHCDGTANCPDGSDETVEACADKICPSYLFQCAYGACVDQGADCNLKQDCADGSDESAELCNRSGTTGIKPTPSSGKCILPPYPNHGTYTVTNVPTARPGQAFESYVLTVRCNSGYGLLEADEGSEGTGTMQVYCIDGGMYQTMPKCVRFCKLDKDPSVTYNCLDPSTNGYKTCKNYVAPGTSVNPVCNKPTYYSSETLKYMKCISGSWDYVALCKAGLVKNGTNITILIRDKVEIYISDFNYTTGNNNNNFEVNVSPVNNNANNNGGVSINVNSNTIGNYINDKDTTINPLNYEISEDDWRMGLPDNKLKDEKKINPNKTNSDVNLNIYNSSVIVSSNKIHFRD